MSQWTTNALTQAIAKEIHLGVTGVRIIRRIKDFLLLGLCLLEIDIQIQLLVLIGDNLNGNLFVWRDNMKKESGKSLLNIFASWEVDNDNILSMDCTCCACPTQFEGMLKDGSCFYFRERHGEARFAIASTIDEAVKATKETAFYFKKEDGDYMPATAADQISKWVNAYFKKLKKT